MTAMRPIFGLKTAALRRRNVGLAVMIALAALWLGAVSRVHVNASWSDEAWGYAAFPAVRRGAGDRRPGAVRAAGYGRNPRFRISRPCAACRGCASRSGKDGTVRLDGVAVARAKTHALNGRPLAARPRRARFRRGITTCTPIMSTSHDSRYAEIGLAPAARILGRAVALPDLPWIGLKGPLVGPEDMDEAGPATILPHPSDDGAAGSSGSERRR